MIRWIIHKHMFPSRVKRWCTDYLKIKTLKKHLNTFEYPVNTIGIRAEESVARSKLPEREISTSLDCMVWRPLLHWTKQDVIDIHHRHDLRPNPLYLQGADRVGCWPCIFSRKSEIRFIAETDPRRIDIIEQLEKEITELARISFRKRKNEEMIFDKTFFEHKDGKAAPPIKEIVEWSKTSHGGKSTTLFREDELEPGCMSWGLCDTGTLNG
jgi:3'-phosphoadenosine 5'-phosphosulfate sulfotransferase (PAPS reductase)/FAD synthetase